MTRSVAILIIGLVSGALLSASASAKTKVTVNFEIAKQGYRDGFPDEIDQLELECCKRILEMLNEQFSFLEFVSATGYQSLRIRLDDQTTSTDSVMQETGFHVTFQDANAYWPFRADTECHLPLGTAEAFTETVCTRFDPNVSFRRDLLVERVFSRILVAPTVLPLVDTLDYWALPLKRRDSKIDYGSFFDIKVVLIHDIGDIDDRYVVEAKGKCTKPDVPPEFQQGILARAARHPDDVDEDTEVRVRGLYIVKYVPYRHTDEEQQQGYSPDELITE